MASPCSREHVSVEGAIESVLAYQELNGLSEDLAIEQTLRDHPSIPGADALRAVLAFAV